MNYSEYTLRHSNRVDPALKEEFRLFAKTHLKLEHLVCYRTEISEYVFYYTHPVQPAASPISNFITFLAHMIGP